MPTTDSTELPSLAPAGLKGVVVAETRVGDVRGSEGFYHYRQYDATDLARTRTFEQVWGLLLDGELVEDDRVLRASVGAARVLPPRAFELLQQTATLSPHQAVCAVLPYVVPALPPTLDQSTEEIRNSVITIGGAIATVLGGHAALQAGRPARQGNPTVSHSADWISMAGGAEPSEWARRAVDAYLVATMDHGFNASTFATRAVVSTGTDVLSALLAGVGSLAGPLHGGAPARALDMINAIGDQRHAASWVQARLQAGDKIMGFGHAVYRTEDPRSALLRSLAIEHGGDLVERSIGIEAAILDELRRWKPEATIATNVEYYAGVVLHLAGIPQTAFTPTFTVSRAVGWGAHLIEQVANNKIVRPSARYVGPPPQPIH